MNKAEVSERVAKIKVGGETSWQVCEVLGLLKGERFSGWPATDVLKLVKESKGSTTPIKAHRYEVNQICGLTPLGFATAKRAFLGRPLRQAVEMTRWVLNKEGTVNEETGEVFDAEKNIEAWADKQEFKEGLQEQDKRLREVG